jgi:transcription elongation factor
MNNLQKTLADLRLHYDVFQVNLGEDVYQVFDRGTQVRVATIRQVMAVKVNWACGVESDVVRAALQNNGLWVV